LRNILRNSKGLSLLKPLIAIIILAFALTEEGTEEGPALELRQIGSYGV
jgi:hypothetical protein